MHSYDADDPICGKCNMHKINLGDKDISFWNCRNCDIDSLKKVSYTELFKNVKCYNKHGNLVTKLNCEQCGNERILIPPPVPAPHFCFCETCDGAGI